MNNMYRFALGIGAIVGIFSDLLNSFIVGFKDGYFMELIDNEDMPDMMEDV